MKDQVFPTWRYHKTKDPIQVQSAEELSALGEGWADSPAHFDESLKAQDKTPVGATTGVPAPAVDEPKSEAPIENVKLAKAKK